MRVYVCVRARASGKDAAPRVAVCGGSGGESFCPACEEIVGTPHDDAPDDDHDVRPYGTEG